VIEHSGPEFLLWDASDPGVRAVSAAFVAGVDRIAPALVVPATRLLARLARPNWSMEWHLPRWLGEPLGVEPAHWRSLMLSNVYGLAYVRLQDDLADGEAGDLPRDVLTPLCSALYALWTGEYLAQFGADPLFWDRFRCYLSQWIEATLDGDASEIERPAPFSPEGRMQLAHRGAPLKICCAGTALLANRPELLDDLEGAVDHLLAAAVLLDHASDWVADLDAGRYNAFVTYASPLPQTAGNREENRRYVREELYLGATARPYYAVIREEIGAADRFALDMEFGGLHAFLVWLDAEAALTGERLAADVQAHLQAAVAELFGPDMHEPAPR
jgi:hypothetical protein